MKRWIVVVLVVAGLVGCTSSDGDSTLKSCIDEAVGKGASAEDAGTFCQAEVDKRDEAEKVASSIAADSGTSEVADDEGDAPDAEPEPSSSGRTAIPDVVGYDLQTAQDTLQEAGFRHLESVDDTGRGRHQVVDSNWIVVSVLPDEGDEVSTAYEITLFVVKEDEY